MEDKFLACLPEDIKLKEIITAPQMKSAAKHTEKPAEKKATVKDILVELKAHCDKGKLVDGAGREIRFYRLIGCWGNPPEDYQEQLEQQRKQLEQLKEKYTVVEISCSQGDPTRIQ